MKSCLSHIEDYDNEIRQECFEFFYWFSRFEFALKDQGFVRAGRYGEAQVDWRKFAEKHSATYSPSQDAKRLLGSPPQTQACVDQSCNWRELDLDRAPTELDKILLVVKTIRNNLFHGGKSSQKDWDDPERNLFLLRNGKAVIDELAKVGDIESPYLRMY